MGTTQGRVVLVDGFAGPGRYEGGEPGSPLLMLNALLEHKAASTIAAAVVYLFIEADRERYQHLEAEIAALSLPDSVKVQIENGHFHEVMAETLDGLQRSGGRLAPTFAFIDPFGYNDKHLALTSRIMGFGSCEVLIYVPLSYIARFVSGSDTEAALDTLYGDDRWKAARSVAGLAGRQQVLHDLFRDRLREECRFVRSFEIVPEKPNTGYFLFFGTNHDLGLRRMKDAMWKIDPTAGNRFRDSTTAGQTSLFDEGPNFTQLESLLAGHFGRAEFSVADAERYVLRDTPFRDNGHLKRQTLVPAERAGRLVVVSSPRKKAGSHPAGTIMRFVEPG